MGIRLVVEVLDHAPADLTRAERLLLVAIAEEANDTTREAWPGMARLRRRLGLAEVSVRHVLERLAARGLELRVALGIDKRGAPFYANRGRSTIYRLPFFVPERRPAEDGYRPERRPEQDPKAPERRPLGASFVPERRPAEDGYRPERRPEQDPKAPERRPSGDALPLSKELLLQQRAIGVVQAHTDADPAEAAAVAELVRAERRPTNVIGFLTALGRDGELPDWLAYLDGLAECEHGVAGGHERDPDGWIRCPIERKRRGSGVA